MAKALGKDGEGVYVAQVAPFPEDAGIPLVARYQAALSQYSPQAEPGFVSLEGYLAGRVAVYGLEACGPEVNRQCFIEGLRAAGSIDIDGFRLEYGPDDNQGSDAVFLTVIGADGKYHRADQLEQNLLKSRERISDGRLRQRNSLAGVQENPTGVSVGYASTQ